LPVDKLGDRINGFLRKKLLPCNNGLKPGYIVGFDTGKSVLFVYTWDIFLNPFILHVGL
jgi:hypothetical protein